MITINELYDRCENNVKLKKITAILHGEGNLTKRNLSGYWYIQDNIVYMFTAVGEDKQRTISPKDMIYRIEEEGEDECWQPESIRDCNGFLNCEIVVIDGTDFDDLDALDYRVESIACNNDELILKCEET